MEAKWPWPGKFTLHFHGIPEERGAMGYFNVTNAPANAVDGKDVAISKSIWMGSMEHKHANKVFSGACLHTGNVIPDEVSA